MLECDDKGNYALILLTSDNNFLRILIGWHVYSMNCEVRVQ